MARRLILDTGVLIAAERQRAALGEVIEPDDDVAIAMVTVAEMLTGVELASERHRPERLAFVNAVMETIVVEPYDERIAQAHSRLLAHVHRHGTPRGAHDLIVAATAVATGRVLVSTDAKARFDDLPGLEVLSA